ncbi:type II toxin-antitoxin system HicB family antitoxin [Sporolactobacillus sp. CPB3-1]|uniref:Type II toxin-antitoxin system HicB family antitoxin n=1 Tax=Sporolactobacillus mangiferae TaxID=2940498 RepID=A0ABT0MBR1_9BACL|nr:type II toxin-antitoxin system HicB family antitoxin [Sporolactobacillus mangiferae]MCL1631780.1 type II toxin-antitoxin system HicB family antitoxin [Sporolactobacillus mangiferae]
MIKDQYIYPALFTQKEAQWTIDFPDLPGCTTVAQNIEEGFARAKESLAKYIYDLEEKGEPALEPSDITLIHAGENQFATLIETWMPPFRKKMENQAVKKTLTIPKWLDDAAKQADLNYSRILQDALKDELNIDESERSFSVQDKLNRQLKKVKKSLKDLSKIRVHVDRANDEGGGRTTEAEENSYSDSIGQELERIKQEMNHLADRLKKSDEFQRMNEKVNQLINKLKR